MAHAIHGAVGFFFAGESVLFGDEVFRKACFPGEGAFFLLGLLDRKGPVHGGEVEPMIRPAEQLLRIGVDQLREKDSVEGGVLADKDRFFSPDAAAGKGVDDRL